MITSALANNGLGLTAMGVMLALVCLLTAVDPIARSHKGLAGMIAGAWCALAPVGLLRSAIVEDPLAMSAWAAAGVYVLAIIGTLGRDYCSHQTWSSRTTDPTSLTTASTGGGEPVRSRCSLASSPSRCFRVNRGVSPNAARSLVGCHRPGRTRSIYSSASGSRHSRPFRAGSVWRPPRGPVDAGLPMRGAPFRTD